MERELVCIVCPNGCHMTINDADGEITVSGNRCKRGESFAREELTCPMRTISSTVRTAFAEVPVLPVRVSKEIPKSAIFDVMREINSVYLTEPVGRGEVIIPNVLSLGTDVIAASNILKEVK